MIKYNKIVRDKIPQIIRITGGKCKTRITVDREETVTYLIAKIKEEAEELEKATTKGGVMEELADLLECIYAIADNHYISLHKVLLMAEDKAVRKGKFTKGVILLEAG